MCFTIKTQKKFSCVIYGCNSVLKTSIVNAVSEVTDYIFIDREDKKRFNLIYFPILAFELVIKLNFINIKNFPKYLRAVILLVHFRSFCPKIVVTYIDNDPIFQLVSALEKKIKFISIQN